MKPDETDWLLLAQLQRDALPSNQTLAEQARISPPTALRRVRRLHEAGLIERQVALLDEDRIAALQGHGLTTIVEVTLDRQGATGVGVAAEMLVPARLAALYTLTEAEVRLGLGWS